MSQKLICTHGFFKCYKTKKQELISYLFVKTETDRRAKIYI